MTEIPIFLQIGGFFMAIAGYTWGVITFLLNTTDKKVTSERKERLKAQEDLYDKIDASKENSVRREDFNRHVDYVEKQFTSFRDDLKNYISGINARLDNVILLITPHKKD